MIKTVSVELITGILFGLILGFLVGWYFISQQKWSDKAQLLHAQWEKKLLETQGEWYNKYVNDITELKTLFQENEKQIREKSVSSSRRTLIGKLIERFVPFLVKNKYAPADMHFLGQPIDYIVFDGLRDNEVDKIVFLEVKTGESKLTKREKSLKEAIQRKRVYWDELRVDTKDNKNTDNIIANEESSIDELYKHIDEKLDNIKKEAFI